MLSIASHPLTPSHAHTFQKEGAALAREGDLIFLKIEFFQGAPPPCTPKGILSPGSLFYFVLFGSETCLPLWGRRCPVGTKTPLAPPKGVLSSGSPFYFVFLGSETCLPLWGRCHAGGVTEGVSSREVPTPVSPAGSGPAPQWGASRTDGRGNGDRFAAERHRRSLTPLPHLCFLKEGAALAREGEFYFQNNIKFFKGTLPLLYPPRGRKMSEKVLLSGILSF